MFFADGGIGNLTVVAFVACAGVFNIFFGLGLGRAGGVFMSLTNPAVGATQFTGYMSLRNLAASYSVFWQGMVVGSHGYATMLVIDGVIAFIPILLIPFLTHSKSGMSQMGSGPLTVIDPVVAVRCLSTE